MKTKNIVIDGSALELPDIARLVSEHGLKVELHPRSAKKVAEAHHFLTEQATHNIIYGVNTGFGPMATHILGKDQLKELQVNLVRSHAVGMGNPIPESFVLAAMVVRLNTLAKGYSGTSIELLEHLQMMINRRILPVIPEHGAVGTSGDLVQLAHIALAIIGEGKVNYKGQTYQTKKLYRELGIKPYTFKVKEGLSLINGTSVMTGIAALLIRDAQNLLSMATSTAALALELVEAYDDSISAALHAVRPHAGQVEIARRLRNLLSTSKLLTKRAPHLKNIALAEDITSIPLAVQEVYSIRCTAQILGPVLDALRLAETQIKTELNSATDNPIVDVKSRQFLHGGNFHGEYIAAAVDSMKIALTKLTILSERRINFFLHHKINHRFSPFLNLKKPGLTLGLQGLQFVATSTTAHSQTLAYPHHIHSIPTNGDNQDVVSMGTDAALIASQTIENSYIVLAIELVTLCQAVDFMKFKRKLSRTSYSLHNLVRKEIPVIVEDRIIIDQLNSLLLKIKSETFS